MITPTCADCGASLPAYFSGQRSCPCEREKTPAPQKTAAELVAEFTAGVAQIRGVFAAYAAEITRLKAAVAERDAALAFYSDDTDLHDENGVLDGGAVAVPRISVIDCAD